MTSDFNVFDVITANSNRNNLLNVFDVRLCPPHFQKGSATHACSVRLLESSRASSNHFYLTGIPLCWKTSWCFKSQHQAKDLKSIFSSMPLTIISLRS